jgi:hypothetical protein
MANPKKVKNRITMNPEGHGALGVRIELGAKSHVKKNKPGMKVEFFVPTVDVLIGIGKDHVAHLIMDEEAWKVLKGGETISVQSFNEFKKEYSSGLNIIK